MPQTEQRNIIADLEQAGAFFNPSTGHLVIGRRYGLDAIQPALPVSEFFRYSPAVLEVLRHTPDSRLSRRPTRRLRQTNLT